MSNRDRVHLARALRVASTSTERIKHGAVVVKSGRVIGVGVNTFRNHPNTVSDPEHESSYHAEINAIRGLDEASVAGAVIYVARVNRMGHSRMSKPCNACRGALAYAGIKRVVWTEDE